MGTFVSHHITCTEQREKPCLLDTRAATPFNPPLPWGPIRYLNKGRRFGLEMNVGF